MKFQLQQEWSSYFQISASIDNVKYIFFISEEKL